MMQPIKDVRWLFIHTAAFKGEAGADRIRQWHMDPPRRWDGIGYHFVVRRGGEVELGRSTQFAGAHVRGVNRNSLGICCEGHGDFEDHTPEQRESLLGLLRVLMKLHMVPVENVLGHREVNLLVAVHIVPEEFATEKTCPGKMVSMEEIRGALMVPQMVDTIKEDKCR